MASKLTEEETHKLYDISVDLEDREDTDGADLIRRIAAEYGADV